MSSEQKIEQILVDLGLTAPRITPAMIDELMREVTYSTHLISGTTTTVATAIDGAGIPLCSVASASASSENFNPALGIEIAINKARAAARDKLWELEGYRLKRALHDARSNTSTKALEQIRAVLGKSVEPGPNMALPAHICDHCSEQSLERAVELSGIQPKGPHDHIPHIAASPLLTAARALAVEVGVTVDAMACGTAVRRQLAATLATPGRGL